MPVPAVPEEVKVDEITIAPIPTADEISPPFLGNDEVAAMDTNQSAFENQGVVAASVCLALAALFFLARKRLMTKADSDYERQ